MNKDKREISIVRSSDAEYLTFITATGEIDENSVIRKFRITAADGKTYNTNHYNLSAIIAVGNKVDSPRAVQFRKWVNRIIEEFTVKGFAMDDERLKNGDRDHLSPCRQQQRAHGADHLEGCSQRPNSEIRCGDCQELSDTRRAFCDGENRQRLS